MKNVKQFEIWTVYFSPTKGSEQRGFRPALVMETNATDNKGRTTIVIPFSTQLKNNQFIDVVVKPNKENGLKKTSKIKLRQIRVIDKIRLQKKLGAITDKEIQIQIFNRLKMLFDFERLFI